jgi:L-ascorbate metabolism protein UlaG (beta-lactamase superfamily)
MSVGHLGDLAHGLENGELEPLEGVDILCVPIGGKSVLTPDKATELISQIEPRIIIPIQYQVAGLSSGYGPLDPFLKAMGAKNIEPAEKFRIQKKDLPADDSQVVVLKVS